MYALFRLEAYASPCSSKMPQRLKPASCFFKQCVYQISILLSQIAVLWKLFISRAQKFTLSCWRHGEISVNSEWIWFSPILFGGWFSFNKLSMKLSKGLTIAQLLLIRRFDPRGVRSSLKFESLLVLSRINWLKFGYQNTSFVHAIRVKGGITIKLLNSRSMF